MLYFSDSFLLAIRLKTIKLTFLVLLWTQILLDTSLKVLQVLLHLSNDIRVILNINRI